jgi:hypothetical protein
MAFDNSHPEHVSETKMKTRLVRLLISAECTLGDVTRCLTYYHKPVTRRDRMRFIATRCKEDIGRKVAD